MRRYVYVAYGDVSKVQLTAAGKPLDRLLQLGFDMYLELGPNKWVRAADLPKEHPIWVEMKAGAFKAGLVDGEGRAFTILNAYNPEHRQLAAQHGLIINAPYTEEKRQMLLEKLAKIKRELRILSLNRRIAQIQETLSIADEIEKIEKLLNEVQKPQQPVWDGTVNTVINALDRLADLVPTNFERFQLQEAIRKAKKEAQLEALTEESLLANPEKLNEIRKMLLA
ncbi:MAG: hypothetical protein QXX59_08940 [Candidatus Bathyarchaeia archaeon]